MPLKERGRKVIRVWTPEELRYLGTHYANTPAADIAAHLGMCVEQVYAKARFLELAKADDYVNPGAKNLLEHGQAHRFTKGHRAWNTGTKGMVLGGIETQFKKGQVPHNWVPIGSYRTNPDGFLEFKFSDEPGPYYMRWEPVHRRVWRLAHGPIPKTHKVAFKPGMKTTDPQLITLDRLELLTHAQLMARNTISNQPPELAEVMRARGLLTRAINKRAKEST
jgi:hypothetical protein